MAVFRAQREVMDLELQLGGIDDRLHRLDRIILFNLKMSTERGIPPERVDGALISLELINRELVRVERDSKRCRELIKRVFKTFGYDNTLAELYGLNDEAG